MSIRPHDGGRPPAPPAIRKWPPAPKRFSREERAWWRRLGRDLTVLGTVCVADLEMCERAAQMSARADAALTDPNYTATALNALLRLELDYRKQLGLSPQSRRAVTPLPVAAQASGFEELMEDDAHVRSQ